MSLFPGQIGPHSEVLGISELLNECCLEGSRMPQGKEIMRKRRKTKKTATIIIDIEIKGTLMKIIEMSQKEVVKKGQKESIKTKGEIEGEMTTTKNDIRELSD